MATNASTGAEVAVKTLLPEFARSSDALARFRDEAHATAKLAHRGIVRVFDLVEIAPGSGSLLIVMELLRGHTLAERLATQGPLPVAETLAVVLPILSALSHAHGAGIVHRDVKPDNVFLAIEPDGQVFPKLVDFGISQLREWGAASRSEGVVVGTPWYMSPEQARGEEVDARCDIFGVGVLLYECLSGTNPFRVEAATSSAHQYSCPVPLGTVPAALWEVIARALAERPEDRFSTAAELAEALFVVSEARSAWTLVPSRPHARVLSAIGIALVAAAFAYRSDLQMANAQEPGPRSARPKGDGVGARSAPNRGPGPVSACGFGTEQVPSAGPRTCDRTAAMPRSPQEPGVLIVAIPVGGFSLDARRIQRAATVTPDIHSGPASVTKS
jgi:serine/threonine-protein kinase